MPNATMIAPPIWLSPSTSSPDDDDSVLLIITPNVENTTEKPNTKNTEFKMMFDLLIDTVFIPSFWFNSERVVPEIYARNAGIIGNMHGATNELNPANAATASVISVTH